MRFRETPGGLSKGIKYKNRISDTPGDFRPIGTDSIVLAAAAITAYVLVTVGADAIVAFGLL